VQIPRCGRDDDLFLLPSISRTSSLARLPQIGPRVPRTGGVFSRWLGQAVLSLLGWHIEGDMPDNPRFVIIAAPHTSNWDFVVGIAAKLALGLRVLWLGKDSLFRFPAGVFMRALGGMPVDRSSAHAVVSSVVQEFGRRDQLIVALAPEGTRKRVERWRTGFYHIAHGASVPIVTVALNWSERAIQIGPPFQTTGNLEADLPLLQNRFADVEGRPRSS
jgi:1-acyl-sn-glycerol-3-phosphate acyltransferase